jgi:hypothetical protein
MDIMQHGQLMLDLAAATTRLLNEEKQQAELQRIKWTDGESNLDTGYSQLACQCAETAWRLTVRQKYPAPFDTAVLQARPPDINCAFFIENADDSSLPIYKAKIELKSAKTTSMPGSTIGKLNINQPLIFVLRPPPNSGASGAVGASCAVGASGTVGASCVKYEARFGQYHTAMGESDYDTFQDRTPRPLINFLKLSAAPEPAALEPAAPEPAALEPSVSPSVLYSEKTKDAWISHYAKCALKRIGPLVQPKLKKASWQDDLTRCLLHEAIKDLTTLADLMRLQEAVAP